jgi:iron complex transport system substrate-binding protein
VTRAVPFRSLVLLVGAISIFLLAGCGDDEPGAAARTSTSAPPVFPVTVEAEQGEVTIERRPEHIVSLSPSLTEMLYAIDAGDQVVAVDRFSDHPAGTPTTDLSGFRPNVEAIAGYDPDLVVLANDRDGVVDALGNLGIPTLLLSSPAHLDGVYDQIELLGTATGHAEQATTVATNLRDDLERIAATASDPDEPVPYYYELSDTYHSVTSDTFIGEILGLAGLASIADEADPAAGGFPQLTAEYVLDADPELIFLAHAGGDTPTPDEVAARPGWDQLQAVQDDRVIVLEPDLASRWGPRLSELLQVVVDATRSGPSG